LAGQTRLWSKDLPYSFFQFSRVHQPNAIELKLEMIRNDDYIQLVVGINLGLNIVFDRSAQDIKKQLTHG
jgi:hypothetical protein